MCVCVWGGGGGRVDGWWGIHYFALKYKNVMFLIVGMVVMDRFFSRKNRRSRFCITAS